jgi:hypothetical protein
MVFEAEDAIVKWRKTTGGTYPAKAALLCLRLRTFSPAGRAQRLFHVSSARYGRSCTQSSGFNPTG